MIIEDNLIKETSILLNNIIEYIKDSPWKDNYYFPLKTLSEEINDPCVLAIAGKVKAGKSYLINALLGIDLAVTGTTETTATVNVFKKGKPLSLDKPVLCQWTNGQKEWKPVSFLKSLQGIGESILEITEKVDKLIFYIDDCPILEDITLVDTPGIGAVVGDDDDAHQSHTESYFQKRRKVREQHQYQTVSLSNSADAVIYLFNVVPEEIDKDFLISLNDNGNGITSINSIGVLSKIDKNDNTLYDKDISKKYASEYNSILYDILPVSAAIYRNLPDYENAVKIKNLICQGIKSEGRFKYMISSENAFFKEDMPDCTLSIAQRQELLMLTLGVDSLEEDYPWRAFVIIIRELYYTTDIKNSLDNLRNISGIEKLRNLIYDNFFSRSRLLRCNKILSEVRTILHSIKFDNYLIDMEKSARQKDNYIEACNILPDPYRKNIINLIEKHVVSPQKIRQLKDNIESKIEMLDELLSEFHLVSEDYNALRLLHQNKVQFSEDEYNELFNLFSNIKKDEHGIGQQFWSAIANNAQPNSVRQEIAMKARNKYGF